MFKIWGRTFENSMYIQMDSSQFSSIIIHLYASMIVRDRITSSNKVFRHLTYFLECFLHNHKQALSAFRTSHLISRRLTHNLPIKVVFGSGSCPTNVIQEVSREQGKVLGSIMESTLLWILNSGGFFI